MSAEDRPTDLAETFAEIARALLAQPDVQRTLDKMVELAVEAIDACDHAGISLVHDNQITTPAASDDVPTRVDAIQYEVDEGPCLEAIRTHQTYLSEDLEAERRWPRFSRRAARETGVRSMLTFWLFVEEETLGALNLYSRRPGAFEELDRAVGSVFATHAAVALSSALHEQHMDRALEGRDTIGQAKGILMAREHVSADQAFDMLRRASQRLNVRLREVAEGVARRGPALGSDQA
jgi:transcriptional regulator with GAF, ATPase, and Fis domain